MITNYKIISDIVIKEDDNQSTVFQRTLYITPGTIHPPNPSPPSISTWRILLDLNSIFSKFLPQQSSIPFYAGKRKHPPVLYADMRTPPLSSVSHDYDLEVDDSAGESNPQDPAEVFDLLNYL